MPPANGSTSGLVYALLSAATFGISGPLGKSLLEAGWSPGAAVGTRIGLAALVMLVPTILVMRGHWARLRGGIGIMAGYGVVAVALCQFCYFNAVARMSPPVALMLEYLAPIIIVGWLWLRTRRRPGLLTIGGTVVAMAGLVLVLNLFSATRVDPIGVLWGLGAAACLAVYFVLSVKADGVLPPFAVVGGGMVFGAVAIGALALVGVLPLAATFGTVHLAGLELSWIVPVLGITLVAAVVAYLLGIIGTQRLGSKVASFVSLTEVLFSVLASWLMIGDVPAPIQALGGVLIVGGVVLVRIDELRSPVPEKAVEEASPEPLPAS
ncbi:EamA family transporter [Sinomonas sp. JGH33]|uniref:EamA family transporter n=1 Tax=Sinomonas terricola TaxID=3110330 RepID=A0ABU5T719_9MICC|nr:EamA family transporter [Sinomonas sp. JGH33]MEA5455475.1 EamA family transporter [Sinomonas sp. JGH33]